MPAKNKYLFGPVPSRRLGRSLGIDLTPFKTCSFDCIFCQLGRTTCLITDRAEYVPVAAVIDELDAWLKNDGQADIITFAGSGEPTLHSGIGEIITHLKKQTQIPVAVLTNGSLLHLPETRKSIALADIVKVSLSAWNDASLQTINRPAAGLDFSRLITGERQFRQEFSGQLWMEVFALDGINSSPEQMQQIAETAKTIFPDRIQLNTAVRPPAESYVKAVASDKLSELCHLFGSCAEVIADFNSAASPKVKADENAIFGMLQRRPCTAKQIADVFGMHLNEVAKFTGMLLKAGRIISVLQNGEIYYTVEKNAANNLINGKKSGIKNE